MKKLALGALVALLAVGVGFTPVATPVATADEGDGVPARPLSAREAFSKLMDMEGEWVQVADEGAGLIHRFEIRSNDSVVMETMMEGTDHEMINMYHLDGDDLVITHYCAGGNQPTMRLDTAHATKTEMPFVFTGGTNLDPAVDSHIHAGKLEFGEDGMVKSHWTGYNNGEEAGTMVFTLKRADG